MKIGFVTANYYPNIKGGGELSLKLLAEQLVKKGHTVLVLSFDSPTYRRVVENVCGVKVVRYKVPFHSALLLNLSLPVCGVMKSWEKFVDVYHVYNVSPLVGAALYKKMGGTKKVIATLNGYAAICPTGALTCNVIPCTLRNRFECLHNQRGYNTFFSIFYSTLYPVLTKTSKNIEYYISLSDFVKRYYVLNGFDSKQIVVVPNFFEKFENKLVFASYKDRTSKYKVFNILYVGSLVAEKGVNVLIEAFSKISQKHSEAHLIIVGSGRELCGYRKLVKDFSLVDKVTFTGQLKDRESLCQIYLNACVFVHPGIWREPFGRTLLEAMSFGVPLLVSNIGAPPQIVDSAGLIFIKGNAEDLARKIELLIKNDQLRFTLSANCTEVLKKFDTDQVVNSIIELYIKLIGKNKQSQKKRAALSTSLNGLHMKMCTCQSS